MKKVSKEAIRAVLAMGSGTFDALADTMFERQDTAFASDAVLDHARLIETYEPHRLPDPDIKLARIVAASVQEKRRMLNTARRIKAGQMDRSTYVESALAGIKAGRRA